MKKCNHLHSASVTLDPEFSGVLLLTAFCK